MWQVKRLLARARAFLRPRRADEEMSREMATHLAMLEDEFRRRGLSREEARSAARRKFGAVERAHDLHREARTLVWLEHLRQDLRYTLRTLAGDKGYTALAIATLALGIGANSAVFSVIHPLMIEPLPFDRPEQLVQLTERAPPTDWIGGVRRNYPLPPDRSRELAEQAGSIAGLFQYFGYATTLFERGDPASVSFAGVSEGMFSTLRARALAGRLLEPDDHEVGADPVVVISHAAWQKYWRGDSNVLGQVAALDTRTGRHRYRVVGVLPDDFVFPVDGGSTEPVADFMAPGDFSGHGTGSGLTTVLRVRDDARVDAAADEIDAVLAGMELQTARFDAATGEVRFAAADQAEQSPGDARERRLRARASRRPQPLGMLVGTSIGRPGSDAEIVGVVGDVRQGGLDSEPYPQVFVDYRQAASRGNVEYWRAFFAVRTTVPDTVIANAAEIVRRFDPEARVENTKLLDEFVADTIMAPRFISELLMAFAAIGAMLAAIGLYGVISYAVTQRTREIGLRMALGANRGAVLSMVLRRGAALSLAGIAAGLLAALAGSRYLASLLFGIEPLDAPTFAVVAFAFFIVAMLASFIPARRATQVDPLVSLRHE